MAKNNKPELIRKIIENHAGEQIKRFLVEIEQYQLALGALDFVSNVFHPRFAGTNDELNQHFFHIKSKLWELQNIAYSNAFSLGGLIPHNSSALKEVRAELAKAYYEKAFKALTQGGYERPSLSRISHSYNDVDIKETLGLMFGLADLKEFQQDGNPEDKHKDHND